MRPLSRIGYGLAGPELLGGLTTKIGFSPRGEDEQSSRHRLREELAKALGRKSSDMAWCTQVHGAGVLEVVAAGPQGEADALVSRSGEHLLVVGVADCCPVLLWDSSGPTIAVAHAGWRGLVAGVLTQTVSALARASCPAARLRVWIGPSIGVGHFEVGEEVAAQFDAAFVRRDRAKPHIDLKAAAAAQLVGAGLPPRAIQICPDDTFERQELYWSYRRDKGICGRHLGYLLRL